MDKGTITLTVEQWNQFKQQLQAAEKAVSSVPLQINDAKKSLCNSIKVTLAGISFALLNGVQHQIIAEHIQKTIHVIDQELAVIEAEGIILKGHKMG